MVQCNHEPSKVRETDHRLPYPQATAGERRPAAIPVSALGAGDVISRAAESIHQERVFRASRDKIYSVLTDARQFAKIVELSGAMQSMPQGSKAAEISREVGGAFAIFGGHIVGRQAELVPDQRMVQAWRVADWKPGEYSIASFDLIEQGTQTKLVFEHKGFPQGKRNTSRLAG